MVSIEEHNKNLADLGCMVSRGDVVLHHACGGSMRALGYSGGSQRGLSEWLKIPLAPQYHTGSRGIHVIGVQTWEQRYGRQLDMLHMINSVLPYDVFELYREEKELRDQHYFRARR